MASRPQPAVPSEPAEPPSAPGVERLPDHLLVRILGALSLRERQCAALVSRRWHGCAHAPELCRDVAVDMYLSFTRAGPFLELRKEHLPSLAAWLERHGQHVRRLSLAVSTMGSEELLAQQLAQCMSAAAASMPQLEVLLISWRAGVLYEITWMLHLPPSLRELSLAVNGWEQGFELTSTLSGLTQLTKLVLGGAHVIVEEGVQLPPSIRHLAIIGHQDDSPLQHQLSSLTHLDTLVVGHTTGWLKDVGVCTTLGRLTRLEYERLALPDWMAHLTGLQHLALHGIYEDDTFRAAAFERQLAGGLQHLIGLTSLLLANYQPLSGIPPPTLAGLSRLQRLCFLAQEGPLPLGPYSASLRVLGASAACLTCSTALLAACDSLEHVAVLRGECDHPGPFWQWAAQHPPLRRLQAAHTPDDQPRLPSSEASDAVPREPHAVTWLRQARPHLEVECIAGSSFVASFKWQDPFWTGIELLW